MPSSVKLGEALENWIEEAVKSGRYASRSEVLREGVRLVQEREHLWRKFEADMKPALDDVVAGRTLPIDEAFEIIRKRIEAKAEKRAA